MMSAITNTTNPSFNQLFFAISKSFSAPNAASSEPMSPKYVHILNGAGVIDNELLRTKSKQTMDQVTVTATQMFFFTNNFL